MPTRPMDGYRVLDFTQNIAGPLAAQVFADLGAQVIKVEPPSGEAARHITSSYPGEHDLAPYFVSNNRGKESVVADLHDPAGVELVLRLAEQTDVFIDAFRPGTMAAWGCGPDEVLARNPRCIYTTITGFGDNGPAGGRPAIDMMLQAEAGVLTGLVPAGERPRSIGFQLIDGATAHVVAQAVLAALLQRERHGIVEQVRVAMFDVAASLQANRLTTELHRRTAPPSDEPVTAGAMPFATSPAGAYRAADGYFMLAAYVPKHWAQLVVLIEHPELATDPRFLDQPSRARHNAALTHELDEVFRTRPAADWITRLRGAGLMCSHLASWADVVASEVFAENELAITVRDATTGRRQSTVRTPARFSTFDALAAPRLPALGEHNVRYEQ
ncbi:MAG: CoA transferase [Frankiales bacterium]|nr:CoA transferase [Frankiales bacterium]